MDKTSKKILTHLISQGKGTNYICAFSSAWSGIASTSIDTMANTLKIPTEDLRAAVRYLKEEGYVEYQYSSSIGGEKRACGFHLSHQGLNYRYFRNQRIKKYIAEKWIDFFALLLSVCALLISVISLLKQSAPPA